MKRQIWVIFVGLLVAGILFWLVFLRDAGSVQHHLAAMKKQDVPAIDWWRRTFRAHGWGWLAPRLSNRERHEQALIKMGYFQVKTFTLTNRTDSLSDTEALGALVAKEAFRDGCDTYEMGPQPNFIRITASTNDMVVWERIIGKWDGGLPESDKRLAANAMPAEQHPAPAVKVGAQLGSALEAFMRDITNSGRPLPSTVSLSDLEKHGYLSTNNFFTAQDMQVTCWVTANRKNPQAVVMSVRLPDGSVTAALADGSTHHLSQEEFAAQLKRAGQPSAPANAGRPL